MAKLADQSGGRNLASPVTSHDPVVRAESVSDWIAVFVLGNMLYLVFIHHELLRLVLLGTLGFK